MGCVRAGIDTRGTYDDVARVYTPIAAAVFVLVVGAIVLLVWRGRRRARAGGADERVPMADRGTAADALRVAVAGPPARQSPSYGAGAAFFTWVTTIFVAGAADRLFLITNVPYVRQVWIFRAGAFVFAVIAYLVVHRLVRRPTS